MIDFEQNGKRFSMRAAGVALDGDRVLISKGEADTLWALPGEVHPSLVLAPDPIKWLQSNCRSACILHERWLTHSTAGVRAVVAHNESHAKALHKLFVWPGAPEIFFHQKKKREAA